MHDVTTSRPLATFLSVIARRKLVRRLLAATLVAVALLASGAGTAFAIHQLSDADSEVDGY